MLDLMSGGCTRGVRGFGESGSREPSGRLEAWARTCGCSGPISMWMAARGCSFTPGTVGHSWWQESAVSAKVRNFRGWAHTSMRTGKCGIMVEWSGG